MSAVPIISEASFDLGPGWAGLVGANGSDQSTLLDLISGQLDPDTGSVRTTPGDSTPVLCEQRVDEPTDEIEAFGRNWDTTTARIRSRLGVDPVTLLRWETLSPGERKRWQVGAELAQEPDVLLLDEPTNHLDSEARSLLVEVLGRYRGCGIIVSHDRALLNHLTAQTIRLHSGAVEIWGGPCDVAQTEWEAAAGETKSRYDSLKREQRQTSRSLGDQRRKGEQKDAERLRVRRTAGKQDLDARGAAATGRHAMGQKAGAKERASTRASLDRLSEKIDAIDIDKDRGGAVSFDFEPSPKEFIVRYEGPVAAGERHLFDVHVEIRRNDRIRLAGANERVTDITWNVEGRGVVTL
jgi:ATPase subunit of ABC transporter with duplicated ATPase domains